MQALENKINYKLLPRINQENPNNILY